jgi:arsenite oxidase large subunit
MAENPASLDVTGSQKQRLTDPMALWHFLRSRHQMTRWIWSPSRRRIDKDNENDLYVSMFDPGGSAGGYENTRHALLRVDEGLPLPHHNRPAYMLSEVHLPRHGRGRVELQLQDYMKPPTPSSQSAPT